MPMIGQRIRQIREQKKLSQGDIEETTGLLRCYVSRVENGHTVPSLETLERFAAALDIPLYRFFYTGEGDTRGAGGRERRQGDRSALPAQAQELRVSHY
jgi:transcriptional regulator with XRE-family HTH domain